MLWIKRKISNKIKNPYKRIYGVVWSFFSKLFGKKKDLKKGIIIFSFPRSGSTWLLDLIAEGSGSCVIFEPFNADEDRFFTRNVRYGIVQPNLTGSSFYNKVSNILKGHYFSRWSSNYTSLGKVICSERVLVKCIRLNYMLEWFNNNFSANKKIILFRHPFAVVSSMIKSPGEWHDLVKEKLIRKSEMRFEEKYNSIIEKCNTLPELLLASWCLETKAILSDYNERSNFIVFYEDIFANPQKTLKETFDYLEIPFNDQILKSVKSPSKTTNKDASIFSSSPLTKWQKDFTSAELGGMIEIYNLFQIPIYKIAKN